MADDKLSDVAGVTGAGGPQDEFQPDPRNVKLLKWAIYIMSALLVIGTFIVIVTIAKRSSNMMKSGAAGFEALDVAVAGGAEVVHMEVDGDRMAVHVRKDGTGPGEILIINIRRGNLDGRIKLNSSQ